MLLQQDSDFMPVKILSGLNDVQSESRGRQLFRDPTESQAPDQQPLSQRIFAGGTVALDLLRKLGVRCIPAEVAQDAQCCVESDSLIQSVNTTKSAETADGNVVKAFTLTSLGAQVVQPKLPALPSFDHSASHHHRSGL